MKNVVLVMNARTIPECLDSYHELPCDYVLMTGYTEGELVRVMATIVENTAYDHYIVTSDDVVNERNAFAAVEHELAERGRTTGYCRITPYTKWVNVVRSPLHGEPPATLRYNWYSLFDVNRGAKVRTTYFFGLCFSGMTRELWQKFPFGAYRGGPFGWIMSDYHLSYRLQKAGYDLTFNTGARFVHLSHHADYLIGQAKPRCTLYTPEGLAVRLVEGLTYVGTK